MASILEYAVYLGLLILWPVFASLAQRNATEVSKKKGVIRKVIPWLLFCVFLSEFSLLIYKCLVYPWNIEPQPSKASEFREMQYPGGDYPLWGWANDYQLPIISTLLGCLMWFCWTIYAFYYRPSRTSWWKKICKVVAYLLFSAIILGFRVHEIEDFLLYAVAILVIAVLLWVAKVGSKKEEKVGSSDIEPELVCQETSVDINTKDNESRPRLIPRENIVEGRNPTSQTLEYLEQISVAEKVERIENQIPIMHDSTDVVENNDRCTNSSVFTIEAGEMMFCKYCGKRIEADSTFCKYCGKKL